MINMSWIKKILIFLTISFLAIQFMQPAHNSDPRLLPIDLTRTVQVPGQVLDILKRSCYDCHSNQSRYPWYINVQPIGWVMAAHIRDGKDNLNFSEFGAYSKRKQANKLRAIVSSISDGLMPLSSYTLVHMEARLGKQERDAITEWSARTKDSLMVTE